MYPPVGVLYILDHTDGVVTIKMLQSLKLNERMLEVPSESHPTTNTGLAAPFASKRMRIRLSSASDTGDDSDSNDSKSETETISEPVKIPVYFEGGEVDRLSKQINKVRKVDYLLVTFIYSNGLLMLMSESLLFTCCFVVCVRSAIS